MSQFNYYPENYTMLCDFYELTMANGYFVKGMADRITYFDIFFREIPDGGGFAIAAGLEQIIDYVKNLHFTEDDIEYLRDRDCFDERFLEMLRNFRFTGDIWAVPEGTPIFPSEPVITVRAPAYQAQFIETYLLMIVNHESLRSGRFCSYPRRESRIYRRLLEHRMCYCGRALRHSRCRHNGALVGADV